MQLTVKKQIHELLVRKKDLLGGNQIGRFSMSAVPGTGKKRWEECIVVAQASAKLKRGGSNVDFLEVLYSNGRAKWYPASLLNDELYTYETVDAFFQDCQTTLQQWAGPFQHGASSKGRSRAGGASDQYIKLWRTHYRL